MIGGKESAGYMGDYKAYKSDAAANGNTYTDKGGYGNKDQKLYSAHVNANMESVLLPHGKGIKLAGKTEYNRGAENKGDKDNQNVGVACVGQ